MKDTVKKFVGKKTIPLNNNEIMLCIHNLQGSKLLYSNDSNILGRIYKEQINNSIIKSKHNYWGTNYKDREFKAVAKHILCYVTKQEGVIESDKILEYVEGSEGTVCYSVSLKLFGDLKYKYQRGISENTEIYSFYDYDDNLGELLSRVREYYNSLLK